MPYDQIASTWKLYSEIDISWSHHDCITLDLHIRGHWPQGPDIVYNEYWPVQQQRWSSSPLWNVAVTSRVAVTRVAAYGGWPYYGMVTIHAYWVRMAWYGMVWHGILACTWSPLTIASLARNWFWDGNCNCLLCLCTPLPTPSTHIRYMYQFDKHFIGPPKPNMKKKTLKPGWTSLHWLKTQGITCPNYHLQSKPTHKRSI